MFVKLRLTLEGVTVDFDLHEVVQIAAELAHDINQYEKNQIAATGTKEQARDPSKRSFYLPSSPADWRHLASKLTDEKESITVDVNDRLILVEPHRNYAADIGELESVGFGEYFATHVAPWHDEAYRQSLTHSLLHPEEIAAKMKHGFEAGIESGEYARYVRAQDPEPTDAEIAEYEKDLRQSCTPENMAAIIAEQKKIADFNHDLLKKIPAQGAGRCDEINTAVQALRNQEIQRGNADAIFRAPNALDIKDLKGATYPELEHFHKELADQETYSDEYIAEIAFEILSGKSVLQAPNFLPNLLAVWFISESSRNVSSSLCSLILFDLITNQIQINIDGVNRCIMSHALIHPQQGERGVKVKDLYGKRLNPSEWGGMHPMCHDGSFTDIGKELKQKSSGLGNRLSTGRQKEGILILLWLYSAILKFYPSIKLELLSFYDLQTEFMAPIHNYDEVLIDTTKQSKVLNRDINLVYSPTFSIALNRATKRLSKAIFLYRSENDGTIATDYFNTHSDEISEYKRLDKKLLIQRNLIVPLLRLRMCSFEGLSSLDFKDEIEVSLTKNPQFFEDKQLASFWYTEDYIQHLLRTSPGNHFILVAQTQLEHDSLLKNNLQHALRRAVINNKPAVLPIRLHGNHWAGLIIKPYDNYLQVIYNDPKGKALELEFRAFIIVQLISEICENATIIDLQLQQQLNPNDCGPFTVNNLTQLAVTDTSGMNREDIRKLLAKPFDGSAIEIRRAHKEILPPPAQPIVDNHTPVIQERQAKLNTIGTKDEYQNLWAFLPSQKFVLACLGEMHKLEIAFNSKKPHQKEVVVNFLVAILSVCINDIEPENFQKQLCPLVVQLAHILRSEKLVWVPIARSCVLRFIVGILLKKHAEFMEAFEEHSLSVLTDQFLNVLHQNKDNLIAIPSSLPEFVREFIVYRKNVKNSANNAIFDFMKINGLRKTQSLINTEEAIKIWVVIIDPYIDAIERGIQSNNPEVMGFIEKLATLIQEHDFPPFTLSQAFNSQLKDHEILLDPVGRLIAGLKCYEAEEYLLRDFYRDHESDKVKKHIFNSKRCSSILDKQVGRAVSAGNSTAAFFSSSSETDDSKREITDIYPRLA